MNELLPGLTPIAIDYLYDGMEVIEDIYNYNGNVLLLAKGGILAENQIQKLKEFNDNNGNIAVFQMTHKALLSRGIPNPNMKAREYAEKKVGYAQVNEDIGTLLDYIESSAAVTKGAVDYIAYEIADKLQSKAPALIFQCINSPRPVDEYLRRHSINVSMINGLMGNWLGLPKEDIDQLVLAGLVHDIGKTKIPPEILNLPRKLTACEFEVIKMHPIYSYDLLGSDKHFTDSVRLAARHHHEKLNGSGYPDKIGVDKISLFAKITAVSDIYDAMVSNHFYKDSNNPFITIANLSSQKFSELDIGLVKLFTEQMPAQLIGKSVLLSDGSKGIIKYIVNNDLEHPLVDVNGTIKKLNKKLFCTSMIFEDII